MHGGGIAVRHYAGLSRQRRQMPRGHQAAPRQRLLILAVEHERFDQRILNCLEQMFHSRVTRSFRGIQPLPR